jgi:hypothetical protein
LEDWLAMLLLFAPGCSIFHDLWFHAEDVATVRDSSDNVVDDCQWFDDPKNCWNTIAAAAASCVPDSGAFGVFETVPRPDTADTAAPPLIGNCAYLPTNPSADYVVKFNEPFTLPLTQTTLNFTVQGPKGDCARVKYPSSDSFELTIEGKVIFEAGQDGNAPVYTCPDGSKVDPTFSEVVSCNQGESHVPGVSLTSTATELAATLDGVAGDSVLLFRCVVEEKDTGKKD